MKALPLKFDGKQTYTRCEPHEATHVVINVPGEKEFGDGVVQLPVLLSGARQGTHCWSWNGDVEKPTFRPSLLRTRDGYVSHSWINDGKAQFLHDSTHELAGQTVELLDLPPWWE